MAECYDLLNTLLSFGRDKYWRKFAAACAESLPFQDEAFDCATIGFGLRNVTDIEKTLGEMARVVKEGGKVVCLEFASPNFGDSKKIGEVPGHKIPILPKILNKIWGRIYHFYLFTILPYLGGLISGRKDAYAYLPHSIAGFLSPQELGRIMEEVGLKDVEIHSLTLGIVTVHSGVKSEGKNMVQRN